MTWKSARMSDGALSANSLNRAACFFTSWPFAVPLNAAENFWPRSTRSLQFFALAMPERLDVDVVACVVVAWVVVVSVVVACVVVAAVVVVVAAAFFFLL